jgi:hypothetical protein
VPDEDAVESAKSRFIKRVQDNRAAAEARATEAERQRISAESEVIRAHELETSAQDASTDRGSAADAARKSNAAKDQQQRLDEGAALREGGKANVTAARVPQEPLPTIEDREVTPADPSRGVQSITLPEVIPPHPGTHIFSKSAWLDANPNGDVEAAASEAKQKYGYEVTQ